MITFVPTKFCFLHDRRGLRESGIPLLNNLLGCLQRLTLRDARAVAGGAPNQVSAIGKQATYHQ
jgi:hypothetical protein